MRCLETPEAFEETVNRGQIYYEDKAKEMAGKN
jgi:hypothetical protein